MKSQITCSDCRAKTMQLVTDRYCAEVKHDGRSYTINLPALEFYRCSECGSVILPDEADQAIGMELRRIAFLLTPDQIKTNRERLGLTQKDFAELLGVADATVCWWETGGQIQQRGYDKTMRGIFPTATPLTTG